MKAPNPKLQAPEKLQAPSTKACVGCGLEFDVWSLSGAWMLELGAFTR